MGWFKRQYASLDVYWADPQFARAFARLEMLDRNLTPQQATKLCSLLLSADESQNYIVVSIGGRIGSGKLIGANEGERLMRPFDASLTNENGKQIVPAKRLEFIGGYAGLWKVTFDKNSVRGPLMTDTAPSSSSRRVSIRISISNPSSTCSKSTLRRGEARQSMKHFTEHLLVPPDSKYKLRDADPEATYGIEKSDAEKLLAKNLERLSVLQYLLYAEARRSLLIVLQGIDAAARTAPSGT